MLTMTMMMALMAIMVMVIVDGDCEDYDDDGYGVDDGGDDACDGADRPGARVKPPSALRALPLEGGIVHNFKAGHTNQSDFSIGLRGNELRQ